MRTAKQNILRITRRTKRGFTVGEIFDRYVDNVCVEEFQNYSTMRARVYELVDEGKLEECGKRKDSATNKTARVFRRPQKAQK